MVKAIKRFLPFVSNCPYLLNSAVFLQGTPAFEQAFFLPGATPKTNSILCFNVTIQPLALLLPAGQARLCSAGMTLYLPRSSISVC